MFTTQRRWKLSIFGPTGRYVEPLEGWTVVECDWSDDLFILAERSPFPVARHGGIAPPIRRRSQLALTLAEREGISRGIASGCSMRGIAQRLNRALA